jgi:ribosomal protein L40E
MQASEQQQKSQSVNKQSIQTDVDSQEVILCPNCGAEVPADAIFCPECSAPLKQHICPKCGAVNTYAADICIVCKTWLLEHQCKFCYAEIPDEASFCPECGKPKEGIPCPHCGNLSIFDFCTKCGKPVTEEAIAEKASAEEQDAQLITPVDAETAEIEAEIAKLKALIGSEPVIEDDDNGDVYDPDDYYEKKPEDESVDTEDEPPRKSLFSAGQMASIKQTGADIDDARNQRAEEARIAEEKRIEDEKLAEERQKEAERLAEKKRQTLEAQDKINALQKKLVENMTAAAIKKAEEQALLVKDKKFSTNQEARCFHQARHSPNAIGWLCNAYGVVHLYKDGGPNDCHEAVKGGHDYFGEIVLVPRIEPVKSNEE